MDKKGQKASAPASAQVIKNICLVASGYETTNPPFPEKNLGILSQYVYNTVRRASFISEWRENLFPSRPAPQRLALFILATKRALCVVRITSRLAFLLWNFPSPVEINNIYQNTSSPHRHHEVSLSPRCDWQYRSECARAGAANCRYTGSLSTQTLTSSEHQHPARYASTPMERGDCLAWQRVQEPLRKELENDESANFHFINAPVTVDPPEGKF